MKMKGDTDNILVKGSRDLKGPIPARLDSAREWYQWIGLSKDMPRYMWVFDFLILILTESSKFHSTSLSNHQWLGRSAGTRRQLC